MGVSGQAVRAVRGSASHRGCSQAQPRLERAAAEIKLNAALGTRGCVPGRSQVTVSDGCAAGGRGRPCIPEPFDVQTTPVGQFDPACCTLGCNACHCSPHACNTRSWSLTHKAHQLRPIWLAVEGANSSTTAVSSSRPTRRASTLPAWLACGGAGRCRVFAQPVCYGHQAGTACCINPQPSQQQTLQRRNRTK